MGAEKRQALEVALRRTLGFHLGEDGTGHHEQLIFALLDAAEDGSLRDSTLVAQTVEDYLPDARSFERSRISSSEQQQDGHEQGVELYEDILRDTLKHFPVGGSNEEDDDDGGGGEDLLEPGCCSLCERHMPLTRHHVMPKSTHKRYRKKGYADAVLNRTITICRPCHSAIHRAHDALTLAEHFTTLEELVADEAIGRFVAWARKQGTTSSSLLRYRR